MTRTVFARVWPVVVALVVGAGAACDNEMSGTSAADGLVPQLQTEIDTEVARSPLTASQVRPVKPVLKCVERLSSSSYRAHFGYTSSSSSAIAIPVGNFYNRFFPSPSGRGQPATFAPGSQLDVVQVTFSSNSAIVWILGTTLQIATSGSKACPPTGGSGGSGTGGSGTGGSGTGGAGGRGGTGGVVGTGGAGTGGATATCPSTCDDHNPCTTDLCNATTGFRCSNVVVQNGTSCTDSNACTLVDQCQNGVCQPGAPRVCTATDQCHVVGVCNTTTGACSNPTAANGVTCNDANACTTGESCQAGVCAGGTPKTCPASDQCHVAGVCAPATGLCSNPNAPNGTTCSDGNMCTTGDACQAGVCLASVTVPPTHCPGGAVCDTCTDDNCVASTDGCDQIVDSTDRQRCETLYACFRNPVNNCVTAGDPSKCWCGTNPDTCFTDNAVPTRANGPCLQAVVDAARLTLATYDAPTIKQGFIDPDLPLGRAVNLTICRGAYCSLECSVP